MNRAVATEAGRSPSDWRSSPLEQSWRVIDCKHVTAKFTREGFPVASIQEVQSRIVDLSRANRTTQEFFALLTEGGRRPQPGDLIMSRNATVGEVALVTEEHPPFAMGQDVCLLRRKSDGHSSGFLQAVLQSPLIERQLTNLMVGSTFKRVNIHQIRNFEIPTPGAEEQRAIAAALSDVDALIAALDQLIAKKRDLKTATMQQLLTGQRRLPGFTGAWSPVEFGDVVRPRATRVDPSAAPVAVPCVELENIEARTGRRLGFASGNPISLKTEFRVGDVLFGKLRAYLRKYWHADIDGLCSTEIWAFVAEPSRLSSRFLAQLVRVDSFVECASTAYGTHMPRADWSVVKRFPLMLPELREQDAIAAILTDMDNEIAALEARRDKTRLLKQGMMQELLTGRTRLVAATT